jgi:hypothetical protein
MSVIPGKEVQVVLVPALAVLITAWTGGRAGVRELAYEAGGLAGTRWQDALLSVGRCCCEAARSINR